MTKSFDVILINTVENLGVYPPLSLCYLQAVLESDKCGNLVTNLLDAGKYGIDKSNVDAVAKMVSKRTPYIVGISSMDTELKVGIHLSKKLKEIDPDIVVCMGGYGSTFQPERCLEKGKCDFVVRGEGELTVGELFPRIIAG